MKKAKGKTAKQAATEVQAAASAGTSGEISSRADLEAFLLNIRDRMEDESAAPIFALSGLNYVMNLPGVYQWLDNETKEIARDIWLRLKQAGFQVRNPHFSSLRERRLLRVESSCY